MFEMTTAQQVRMRTMELVREHYKDTTVAGLRPEAAWLITKAKPIEKYILFGNDQATATAEGY